MKGLLGVVCVLVSAIAVSSCAVGVRRPASEITHPDIELDASQLGVAGIAGGDDAVHLRGGKVARVVWFLSRAEALEAVGLSE